MTVLYVQYRLVLPYTLDQYNICQRHMASSIALQESKGEVSIKVLKNEKYSHEVLKDCQITIKHMDIANKLPSLVTKVMPNKKALHFTETAYNAYPRCNTTYISQYFSEEKFKVTVDSLHLEGNIDINNNMLEVPDNIWSKTQFIDINLTDKPPNPKYDPSQVMDAKWVENCEKVITTIKHVTIEMHCFGLGWLTKNVRDTLTRVFLEAHQRSYMDRKEWENMTIEDIKRLEDEVRKKLDEIDEEKK